MLGKDKLDTIEILISKSSINSYISHDEYILVNNVLRKYYRMKEDTMTKCDEIVCVMDIVSTKKANTIVKNVTSTPLIDNYHYAKQKYII